MCATGYVQYEKERHTVGFDFCSLCMGVSNVLASFVECNGLQAELTAAVVGMLA